jgi:uncharacterized repeat protein (TIGR03806 family)
MVLGRWTIGSVCLVAAGCVGTVGTTPTGERDAGPRRDGAPPIERDAGPGFDGSPPDAGPIGMDAAGIDAGNPLLPRVSNETCRLPEVSSGGPVTYRPVDAFPMLPGFSNPVWVGTAPDDNTTMFVVEQGGTIYAFDKRDDVAMRSTFLRATVMSGGEEGLLGLAFHPDYADNDRFYVYYSSNSGCPSGFTRCSVISEYRRSAPRMADAGSERRLLVIGQPYSNHNGGDMHFGNDGYLYIALGDGGSGGDPDGHGQNRNSLLGKILRIDVDTMTGGRQYGIPAGNPFADGMGGRAEIYAWGLRNPWRMRFDRVTGALWIGDVGQGAWEEVDKITEPGNLGWNIREGEGCYGGGACEMDGLVAPIYDYDRGDGNCVTGGAVYRGPEFPDLYGLYLFADYGSGRVWSLRERAGMAPEVIELFDAGSPTSFGEDNDGRLYITSFGRGILKLEATTPMGEEIPELLSDTGCFTDTAAHTVAPGVIPYDVSMALWSDGAEKLRYLALPNLELAEPTRDDAWEFPVGTVFIKTFTVEESGRAEPRRLETRMLTRDSTGWHGYTWRWNDAQTDAVLLPGSMTETIDTPDGELVWNYPSRAQCDNCHTDVSGHVLGVRTRQLNRPMTYDGVTVSQLGALEGAGFFASALGDPSTLPSHPRIDDMTATIDSRVRAYLDVNCAQCHQPSGPTSAAIDLRVQTVLEDMGICDTPPMQGDLGIAMARILAPGEPARSVLHARMNRRGMDQMPPLATTHVDDRVIPLLEEWIRTTTCP